MAQGGFCGEKCLDLERNPVVVIRCVRSEARKAGLTGVFQKLRTPRTATATTTTGARARSRNYLWKKDRAHITLTFPGSITGYYRPWAGNLGCANRGKQG